MPVRGPLSHIDIWVSQPDFAGGMPRRACWAIGYPGGGWFGIEVRPAEGPDRAPVYDRYAPGPHHMAFHAESAAVVDAIHARLQAEGFEVLDAPTDYGGQAGYGDGYYAAFFADPDGFKIEVVCEPYSNS